MPALSGAYGSVLLASPPAVALSSEVLMDSGDHQTFRISTASYGLKRYWNPQASWTVQTTTDGSTWTTVPASGYSIRYLTGQVTLTSALSGSAPGCRVTGAYLPTATLGQVKDWTLTLSSDLADVTTMQGPSASVVFKQYVPLLLGAEVKLSLYYADATFWTLVQSGTVPNQLILVLYTGRTSTERYEAFARVKQDEIKLAVDAIVEEGLDCTLDGLCCYFSGQYA
ncbi:MAG: hypothetical protein IRZ03_14710 [Acidobacterium ailaaui]|nr:hypothetical protein [Pseudacidobacterium ailaaui]